MLIKIRHLFTGLLAFVLLTTHSWASPPTPESLIALGNSLFQQGSIDAAVLHWGQAARLYKQQGNLQGYWGSLANQGVALQSVGEDLRACNILSNAFALADCPTEKTTVVLNLPASAPLMYFDVLKYFGDTLRKLGRLEKALHVIEWANQHYSFAFTSANPPSPYPPLLLSLANTEQALYQRTFALSIRDPLQLESAYRYREQALSHYQLLSGLDNSTNLAIPAQLNFLAFVIDLNGGSDANVAGTLEPTIQSLLSKLKAAAFDQLPLQVGFHARLAFVNCLLDLHQENLAQRVATDALYQAKSLNPQALSLAYGTLGRAQSLSHQSASALDSFAMALQWSEAAHAPELAYQWHDHQAQLYAQQGAVPQAMLAFQAAIARIHEARQQLVPDPLVQFSFLKTVKPVYQRYMALLLHSGLPNYDAIIDLDEELQLSELESFLQCANLKRVPLRASPDSTIIHLLDLGDQVAVIAQSSSRSAHWVFEAQPIRRLAFNLLLLLRQNADVQSIQSLSAQLYETLIAPLETQRLLSGTLVFIPDAFLQELPLSLLFDGHQYLVERFPIAEHYSAQLLPPKPLSKFKVLALGLASPSPSFFQFTGSKSLLPLPGVRQELAYIRAFLPSKILLDQDFTRSRLERLFNPRLFQVLHIATHGEFSSNPDQTVILTWDHLLSVRDLKQMLQSQDPLELLVLSACQTAAGDERSTLGIAGIAAQAGARSTLAALWSVEDKATMELMAHFYQFLSRSTPKAQSLRQAQLRLIHRHYHPKDWAAFTLIGSWL